MDEFAKRLNDLLVELYDSILHIEEQMIRRAENLDLTIGEIHLLEAVGRPKGEPFLAGRTISELSEAMNVTLPSVTVAINKLVKKGYVEKRRHPEDGRAVQVTLTRRGEKVEAAHRYFHKKMVAAATEGLTEEEKAVLIQGIEKLGVFFEKNLVRS